MTTVTIEVRGEVDAVRERLQAMRARAQNLVPAWDAFLSWWANQNRLQFGTRGARWGTPWAELSPRYLRAKRAEGWTADTLVRTSDLLRSLTDRPLSVEHMDQRGAAAGTRVPYAHFHQDGTRHMPARPLIDALPVAREGAAGQAVLTWIIDGDPRVRSDGV